MGILENITSTARKGDGKHEANLDPDKNAQEIVDMLNDAIATEMVCVLRYRRHYYTAKGIDSDAVKKEFLEHSNEEFAHVDMLAKRIEQLGGNPELNPDLLTSRSHAAYSETLDLKQMIQDNLEAERIAIDKYREMIDRVKERDSTTRKILEDILAQEEEHASDLKDMLG